MADFIFKISPDIILGSYTVSRLGQYVQEFGQKFMVILDPILKEQGVSQKIVQALENRGLNFFTFDEIPVAADTEVIKAALTLARQAHVHGIIAAGGGKTLSIAKSVSTLYNENRDLYYFADGEIPSAEPLPLICIPTTCRDNFIFTDKAPMVDSRSSKLKLIKTNPRLCKLVVWDPNLTTSLTEKQVSAMALETLCLATEAYLSPKSTFFSDMLIEKSVQLLSYAIDGSQTLTVTTPQEVLLAQGGCMASLGAATASIGPATLLALTINSRYKISRSLISTIFFPYVIEDGVKYRSDKLAKISRLLGVATSEEEDIKAATMFADYIRQHIARMNIPARLKELSISIDKLSLAAEDAGDLEMINSLPRSMTSDDLFELIKQAY
ncbi:MAG: iron-containing alcohol dehydrogenase [Treponema sp.]|nr:iron-containing alcohol dehydrogenase [Treponema sp.]